MEFNHYSVLLEEVLDNLNIKPDGLYLDGTLGGAGHSFHIAERLTAGGHLYGTDQDADAIEAATKRLQPFEDRVTVIRDNYEKTNHARHGRSAFRLNEKSHPRMGETNEKERHQVYTR